MKKFCHSALVAAALMMSASASEAEWKTQHGTTEKLNLRYSIVYSLTVAGLYEDIINEISVDCFATQPMMVSFTWAMGWAEDPDYLKDRVIYKFNGQDTVKKDLEIDYYENVGYRGRMELDNPAASSFLISLIKHGDVYLSAEQVNGQLLDVAEHPQANFKKAFADACSWHADYAKHVR